MHVLQWGARAIAQPRELLAPRLTDCGFAMFFLRGIIINNKLLLLREPDDLPILAISSVSLDSGPPPRLQSFGV
eukprot:SAG11_NODE_54_length_19571_cov_29.437786_26_plen_74_part_00